MSTSDIFSMSLPVVLAIIMGIFGAVRGFRREAIVSGSVALGALIVQQWASLWSDDLYGMYTGMSREMLQVVLSSVVLALIVLVIGYGLGSLVRRGGTTGGSRVGGLLLGLANGSAIGGWILRYIYTSLDAAQPTSNLYQNSVTQAFMIWAGWYPVALAVIGALVALIAPFRRSEVEVTQTAATPATAPVWTPPPATPAYTGTSTTTTTAYGAAPYGAPQPSRMSGPVGAATPYDRTVANLSPYAAEPRPQGPYDAPPTRAYGGMDVPPPALPPGQYNPAAYGGGQYGTATQNFPQGPRDAGAAPPTNVLYGNQGGTYQQQPMYRSAFGDRSDTARTEVADTVANEGGDAATTADARAETAEGTKSSSDWLTASTATTEPEIEPAHEAAAIDGSHDTHAEVEAGPAHEAETREAEPSMATATVDGSTGEEAGEAGEAHEAAAGTTPTPAEVTCSNCGAKMPSNARFCTECGTPIAQA